MVYPLPPVFSQPETRSSRATQQPSISVGEPPNILQHTANGSHQAMANIQTFFSSLGQRACGKERNWERVIEKQNIEENGELSDPTSISDSESVLPTVESLPPIELPSSVQPAPTFIEETIPPLPLLTNVDKSSPVQPASTFIEETIPPPPLLTNVDKPSTQTIPPKPTRLPKSLKPPRPLPTTTNVCLPSAHASEEPKITEQFDLDKTLFLMDQVISSWASLIDFGPNPEVEQEKYKLYAQNQKDFCQVLLKASDSDKHLVFNHMIEHINNCLKNKYGFGTHEYAFVGIVNDLLMHSLVFHSKNRQALLNAVKKLNILDEIDIQRHQGYLNESKKLVFQRKIAQRGDHTSTPKEWLLNPCFSNDDIVYVSKIKKEEFLKHGLCNFVKVAISENNRVVLHQQAMKSCGPTCVEMLLMDLGYVPNLEKLEGHLSNEDQIMTEIKTLPLKEIRTKVSTKNAQEFLEILQKKIHEHGSAIVGVSPHDTGGHFIICDEVSADLQTVRIREPWHGWEISLHAEAFLNSVSNKKYAEYTKQDVVYSTIMQQLQTV